MTKLFQLQCGVQSYDWGKIGASSTVAQLAGSSDASFSIEDDKPYAELWMGTHPKAPSRDTSGKSLQDILESNPSLLGNKVASKFGQGVLPFLFKVLSIEKALSIQAHPDKSLGAILHETDPNNYPDDNHKPEMAIALTEFEGFCGFRPLEQIVEFLNTIPELVELVGEKAAHFFKSTVADKGATEASNKAVLQFLFGHLMRCPEEKVKNVAQKLVNRAETNQDSFGGSAGGAKLAKLIVRLNKQFPLDIGLFCGGLLLNYVELQPGEAMFLRAKDPHAYISGDIIECMAASDNVVRAGFTPKFKDVDTLVYMLTYSYGSVASQKMEPQQFPRASGTGSENLLFDPPIEEFSVLGTRVQQGATAEIKGIDGPSILIFTKGKGTITDSTTSLDVKSGYVFFIGANDEVKIKCTEGELIGYRAFTEV